MKNALKLTIFLIPIGIAVNFVGGQIAMILKLPLFLDSIGTIVIGALCGPIAGALVGLITNISISITNPQTLFYAINNIIFGLLAGYLAQRGVFKVVWKTLVTGVVFGIIGGVVGATISIFIFDGFGAGSTGIFAGLLMSSGLPIELSAYISEISIDLIDKVPTILIVYLIINNLPQRTLVKLPQGQALLKE